MNSPKFLQRMIKVLVILPILAGCVTPEAVATPSPALPTPSTALPTTAVPPTAILVSTPTFSLLVPGDKIGEMSVEIPSGFIPNWLDYCLPAFSDQPGGEKVDCSMPLMAEFEIGAGWGAKDEALLDAGWEALTWELYVDDHPVDLNAFGTQDIYWQAEDGTPIKLRLWNIKLVNAPAGEHTVRYIIHINQEVEDGFAVTPPGTLESRVNLTLAPAESFTATPAQTPPPAQEVWWNHTVFYEVFVRSFADSTTGPLANDGIGDLQGLIEKLDYLNDGDPTTTNDLGVTGIWLMPIMQSPSYHGYDVTDYYTVNKDYGTNEDLKRLLQEAHQRGIKVIVDLVLNHTSSEHPWFVEARDNPTSEWRDWYIWSEENPGYLGPWGQAVWHASPTGYYYGLFWSGMPDLNYENPQASAEMETVTRFWLEEVGVDGFRLDGAPYLIEEGSTQMNTEATHEWWKEFRSVYKASNPEAMTVGEVWTSNYAVVDYLQGDEFDLAFDFDLASAIVGGVQSRNAGRIKQALTSSYGLFGKYLSAPFLTNHDINRVMSQLQSDVEKAKLAASVLLTAPGVPFIYYGEEIGMTGMKPDEMIRTPMQWSAEDNAGFTAGTPWEPVNADYLEKNVAVQLPDPASLLSHYRELVQLRLDYPALQVGDYWAVDSQDDSVLAFLRTSQDEHILVVINLNAEAVSDFALTLKQDSLDGTYRALLLYSGEAELPELVANDKGGFDAYQPLSEIPAGGTVIIQLQPTE